MQYASLAPLRLAPNIYPSVCTCTCNMHMHMYTQSGQALIHVKAQNVLYTSVNDQRLWFCGVNLFVLFWLEVLYMFCFDTNTQNTVFISFIFSFIQHTNHNHTLSFKPTHHPSHSSRRIRVRFCFVSLFGHVYMCAHCTLFCFFSCCCWEHCFSVVRVVLVS